MQRPLWGTAKARSDGPQTVTRATDSDHRHRGRNCGRRGRRDRAGFMSEARASRPRLSADAQSAVARPPADPRDLACRDGLRVRPHYALLPMPDRGDPQPDGDAGTQNHAEKRGGRKSEETDKEDQDVRKGKHTDRIAERGPRHRRLLVAGVPEGHPTLEVGRSRQWLDAVQAGTEYGPHVNAPTL